MSAPCLVIRLSSLGDVVLCGAVTGGLGPVVFLTRRAWAEVAAALPGVVEVLVWEELPAGALERPWRRVVDLHASPRSRRLCLGLSGPVRRVRRYDWRRRLRVWLKAGEPPPPVVERYAEAAQVPVAPRPWVRVTPEGPSDGLGLVPGAAHASKRWPAASFVELGRCFAGPVWLLGGPGEAAELTAMAECIGSRAQVVAERGFARTMQVLASCRQVVGGDTGLLHLARAMGRPTLTLLGPTTAADGFWSDGGAVLELDLPCRPCSLHGGPVCPVGDHLCLRGITVDQVALALAP